MTCLSNSTTPDFERFEGKRTLVIGETGTGKTAFTASLLEQALAKHPPSDITVLDFAPGVSGPRKGGAKLTDYYKEAASSRYFVSASISITAPRLEGQSAIDIIRLAEQNAEITSGFLESYLKSPTPLLFVNDLAVHLQAGDLGLLLKAVTTSKTFVANAYSGRSLDEDKSTGISRRERDSMEKLIDAMDLIVRLPRKEIEELTRNTARGFFGAVRKQPEGNP